MSEEDFLPDDQQEDLDDIGEAGRTYTAVINSTDWTVQTIIQQIDKGNIELNPDFQRREAWRTKRKSQYIESLIINVPVPQIVLAERKEKRGKFIVIDGKQRLLALRQFYSTSSDRNYAPFKLTDLTIRRDLIGVDHQKLSSDMFLEPDMTALDNSTVRTAVIKNWKDEDFLYTIFLRLNTGSVPLSPQELRQALHPGEFVKFIDDYSISSEHVRRVMHLSRPDFRMRDAELVIRFFAFRNFLHTYTGNLKPLLDKTAEFFNKNWAAEQPKVNQQKRELEFVIETAISIFGESNAFRKWNGQRYESSLNRAVFDALAISFIDERVAAAAVKQKNDVETAFKRLCVENNDFLSSIEGTTKSIHSIYTRIHTWSYTLKQVINEDVILPELIDNRVVIKI